MNEENILVKTTVRLPKQLIQELKDASKKHHRNFNNEVIVAIEYYLADWKNKH